MEANNCEHEYEWEEQQSEPHKGHDYYYCPKCGNSWKYDPETDSLTELGK